MIMIMIHNHGWVTANIFQVTESALNFKYFIYNINILIYNIYSIYDIYDDYD